MSFFFFLFELRSVFKETTKQRTKKNHVSVRREPKEEVIHRQSNLVWWDICVILSDASPV